jgi:tryptophan synthase beta chain
LKDTKRAEYVYVDDQQASDAFRQLNLLEGILPALESAHALAYGAQMASQMSTDKIVIINLSGRGDKDIPTIAKIDGISIA